MAVAESIVTTPQPITAAAASMPGPKSQPLWRFALVGLGPLTSLGVFALTNAPEYTLAVIEKASPTTAAATGGSKMRCMPRATVGRAAQSRWPGNGLQAMRPRCRPGGERCRRGNRRGCQARPHRRTTSAESTTARAPHDARGASRAPRGPAHRHIGSAAQEAITPRQRHCKGQRRRLLPGGRFRRGGGESARLRARNIADRSHNVAEHSRGARQRPARPKAIITIPFAEPPVTFRRDRFGESWHLIPAGELGSRTRAMRGQPRHGTPLSETYLEVSIAPAQPGRCSHCDGTMLTELAAY